MPSPSDLTASTPPPINDTLAEPHSPEKRWQPLLWLAYVVLITAPIAYFFGITRHDLLAWVSRSATYLGDFAVCGAILLAAFGVGSLARDSLTIDDFGPLDLLFSLTLGLGSLSLLILGFGVVGLFYPSVFAVLVGIGIFLAVLRRNSRSSAVRFYVDLRELGRQIHGDGLATVATIAAIGSVCYSLIINALVPPWSWDSIAYHLAIPQIYLAHHSIIYIPYIVHSNWPFNMEMLYTVGLAIGSERVPGLITISFLVVGELTLLLTGSRRYNIRVGAFAAAFYAGIPDILKYAGTADVDIPLAVYGFLAVIAFYEALIRRNGRWFALAGALAGFSAGCKLTGASTGLICGLFLIALLLARRQMKLRFYDLLAFAIPLMLLSAPWYVKSWIVTGNPVYPFVNWLFPSRNWDNYGEMLHNRWLQSPGTGVSLKSLVLLPWNLFITYRFGTTLGPLLLVLSPVALFTRKNTGLPWLLATFSIATTGIWFVLTQQPRFLSPALLALALLAAIGAAQLIQYAPRGAAIVPAAGLVVWFLLQFPLSVPVERDAVNGSLAYVGGRETRETFLNQHIDAMPVFEYANAHLPPNAYIFLLLYEDRGFYLHRRYFWANPLSQRVVRFEQIPTAADLANQLNSMGFDYVIINPNWNLPTMPYAKHFEKLVSDYRTQYLQPIFSANKVTLYRIRH